MADYGPSGRFHNPALLVERDVTAALLSAFGHRY
jgi:hypothetical protein